MNIEKARAIFEKRIENKKIRTNQNIKILERICSNINDTLIDTKALEFDSIMHGEEYNKFEPLLYRNYSTVDSNSIHNNAMKQILQQNNIPWSYYKHLIVTQWGRELLRTNINEHFNNANRNILLREIDGQIRGYLSDRYKRIDTAEVFGNLMHALKFQRSDIFIIDAYISDTRNWIDFADPNIMTIDTPENGQVYVMLGLRFSSSDFGDGALQLQRYITNIVCDNGLTRDKILRSIHLGRKMTGEINYSDRTHKLDTAATISAIRDIVQVSFTNEAFEADKNFILKASGTKIDAGKSLAALNSFTKHESADILNIMIENDPLKGIEGSATPWKLAQAMTAYGNTLENTRRSKEIDELAGNYLETIK